MNLSAGMPQYAKEFGTLSINKGSKRDWRIKATVPFFLHLLSRSHNFSIIILSWGCFFGHFLCQPHNFCKPSISLGRLLGTCYTRPNKICIVLFSWGRIFRHLFCQPPCFFKSPHLVGSFHWTLATLDPTRFEKSYSRGDE